MIRSVALRSSVFLAVILAAISRVAIAGPLNSSALDAALRTVPGSSGACVSSTESRKLLYSRAAEIPLQPASIQKLIVTSALFEDFGPESRFATELYLDSKTGASGTKAASTLYLRGLGDPSLTTERLWLLARTVSQHGISALAKIVIDDSVFDGAKQREGTRAYLGGASALTFDFNSVAITACATSPGHPAVMSIDPLESGIGLRGSVETVASGESAVAIDEQQDGRAGIKIHGKILAGDPCVTVHYAVEDPAFVAGETFRRYLAFIGVTAPAPIERGTVPASARLLEHFASEPLHQIAWGMNHYSTNVIAEQFLMALGGAKERALDSVPLGTKLNRDRALQKLNAFAHTVSPMSAGVTLADASGLSHDNRVPARLFCELLTRMAAQPNLNVELEDSLSVSGRSGTLLNRSFDLPQGVVRAKTGTLEDVSSLAGYLVSERGTKYAFAIIQNSSLTKREAVQIESRFVRALYHDGGK